MDAKMAELVKKTFRDVEGQIDGTSLHNELLGDAVAEGKMTEEEMLDKYAKNGLECLRKVKGMLKHIDLSI